MRTRGNTILLVEDDPNDVLLFERALVRSSIPCSLRVAPNGQEAVEYLSGTGLYTDRARNPIPDLVLLDLKLPRMSGLEVLEWFRRRPEFRHIPVNVLTSSRERSDVRRACELGATSYMVKPVEFSELARLVDTLVTYWLILNRTPEGK